MRKTESIQYNTRQGFFKGENISRTSFRGLFCQTYAVLNEKHAKHSPF